MATIQPQRRASQSCLAWLQLIIGIICMVMIANLQYGWTFSFPNIQKKFRLGSGVDPGRLHTVRPVRRHGSCRSGVVSSTSMGPADRDFLRRCPLCDRLDHEFYATSLARITLRRSSPDRRGRRLWHLHRQRAQWFPGPARPRRGSLRRVRGGSAPDPLCPPSHDQDSGFQANILQLRPRQGINHLHSAS